MDFSNHNEPVDKKVFGDCDLPPGWLRLEVRRQGGASKGKIDTYYLDPDKKKYRSKVELSKKFGDTLDLTNFDYRTGKMLANRLNWNKSPVAGSSKINSLSSPKQPFRGSNNKKDNSISTVKFSSPKITFKPPVKPTKNITAKHMLEYHKASKAAQQFNNRKSYSSFISVGDSVARSSAAQSSSFNSPTFNQFSSRQGPDLSFQFEAPASLVAQASRSKLNSMPVPNDIGFTATNGTSDTLTENNPIRNNTLSGKKMITQELIVETIINTLGLQNGLNLDPNLSISDILVHLAERIDDSDVPELTDSIGPIFVEHVTESDIRAQEAVVESCRQRLAEAIKKQNISESTSTD